MLTNDLLKETYLAITANKARSALTILGIVIGIGSVIALIAIGQGAQTSITESIESTGSNLLMVSPGVRMMGGVSQGAGSAQSLTLDDAETILNEAAGVVAVASEVSSRYQVTYKSANTNTGIIGTEPDYQKVRNLEIENGNFISAGDVKSTKKVAVLGPDVVTDLFSEDASPIGEAIRINKMNFTVIGITKETGGGMMGTDNSIFVPLTTAQRYFTGNDSISTINIQVENPNILSLAQEETTNVLLNQHNISNPDLADFRVTNLADIVEAATAVTGTLTVLLGAIAGISLLVGGIGIMNMMLTSVTERTREIGLRKAIGAKTNDISKQFLSESIMLTFVGGIGGIILGWLIAYVANNFYDVATTITGYSILLAFGVSAGIGIIFGYYPARRASKLDPIEALRYE